MLSVDQCERFRYAEIPVIIVRQKNDRQMKIEMIFNRINSSGRKLSAHDIRQANNLGKFPDLVRRVATELRGDYTYTDRINLLDMPKISLRSEGLRYGVNPRSSFWIRHDIFTIDSFKQSKDEELLAGTIATCLLGSSFVPNSRNLSRLYTSGTPEMCKITEAVEEYGFDNLESICSDIIKSVNDLFLSVDSTLSSWLFKQRKIRNKDVCFSVLFTALFMLQREGYVIGDYCKVANVLKRHSDAIFGRIIIDANRTNRINAIEALCSILKGTMVKSYEKQRSADEDLVEQLLSLSPTELQMVEFKVGLTDFGTGAWNDEEINKIGKTLTAMSNTRNDKSEHGYVIIGIANDDISCCNWQSVYGQLPIRYGSYSVVGIQAEATRNHKDVDSFVRAFTNKFERLDLQNDLKEYALENMRVVDFHDKYLLLIPVCHTGNSKYNGVRNVRHYNMNSKSQDENHGVAGGSSVF